MLFTTKASIRSAVADNETWTSRGGADALARISRYFCLYGGAKSHHTHILKVKSSDFTAGTIHTHVGDAFNELVLRTVPMIAQALLASCLALVRTVIQ